MPYGLLAMYATFIVAGISMLYWSGPVSRASDVLTRYLSRKVPALNKLRWTSEEFNLKRSRTCVRISGAILFACGASYSLGIFLVLYLIRIHHLGGQFFTLRYVFAICIAMFAVLFLVAFRCSRPHVVRHGEAENIS